jgi:hypothetical protein
LKKIKEASDLKKYVLTDVQELSYNDKDESLMAIFKVNHYKNVLPIKETISKIVIATKQYWGIGDMIYLKKHS